MSSWFIGFFAIKLTNQPFLSFFSCGVTNPMGRLSGVGCLRCERVAQAFLVNWNPQFPGQSSQVHWVENRRSNSAGLTWPSGPAGSVGGGWELRGLGAH